MNSFAYVHRESIYCYGQRFVLTDGAVPGLSGAPRWDLFSQMDWHHFAMAVDPSLSQCSVFVNGQLFVQATVNGIPSVGAPERLVLGQLVQLTSPSPSHPFQGSIDEMRLWCGSSRYPGIGLSQMQRGLLASELSTTTELLSYWNMDKEPLNYPNSTELTIIDVVSGNNGTFISILDLDVLPRTRFPPATLGPSTAPLLTEDGIWFVHINGTAAMSFPFRYLCLDAAALNPISCAYPANKTITSFPTAGQLYAVNSSSSQQTALYSGTNTTILDTLSYQPIAFLLNANNGFDSFRWSVSNSSVALVQLYAAPFSGYSTRNQSMGFDNPTVTATSDFASPIILGCGSTLGERPRIVITSAPATGQMLQITPPPMNLNPSIPINATASVQIIPCPDLSNISPNCIVSHPGGAILYQPLMSIQPFLNLSLSYACLSSPSSGYSANQTIHINWSTHAISAQIPFVPTMVGPNPYALQFDGQWTTMTASMPPNIPVSAISLWVQPRLNPVFDVTTGYLEIQTVLQMFPTAGSTNYPFEMLLHRNASSYPNFFLIVNQFNLDNTTAPVGAISISTYSSSLWIQPNIWTNILLTLSSGSQGAAVLYLDGSPVTATTLGTVSSPATIQLGSSLTNSNLSFSGTMDEFTLWSKPLGAFDILAMQYEAVAPYSTGLEAYWSFNEGLGSAAYDAVRHVSMTPNVPANPAQMPMWVAPMGLTFSSIETSATTPQIITLATHSTPYAEKWQLGIYLSELPTNGFLYQLPLNCSLIEAALLQNSSSFSTIISQLDPISNTFSTTNAQMPMVRHWASTVLNVSSCREAPVGTSYWNSSEILGPPSWWGVANIDDEVTLITPPYGDSTQSWCPEAECATPDPEWIELTFVEALYIRRVEIFQNLRPGAVTKILAWDEHVLDWRVLYAAEAKNPLPVYSTLRPYFCSYTSFKSDTIRIELNPCAYPGWTEIEAVRVHGSRELPPGVVSHPLGKVLYVPDRETPGSDKVSYTASPCPFTLPTASPSFTYQMFVAGVSAIPLAYSLSVDVTARAMTRVTLPGYSPSASNPPIQRVISRLPAKGQLYNAISNNKGELIPGSQIQGSGDLLISNADGIIFFSSPSDCTYNMTTFNYYVTSEGVKSSVAIITINSLCSPSFLNYRRWLAVVLFVLLLLAIAFAVGFGLYAFVNRKKKPWEADRPPLLVIAAVGAFITYISLLFELAPVTVQWCIGRTWMLHIGTTMIVASALAQALFKWHDFTSLALMNARPSTSTSQLPPSVVICFLLALAIELTQLIIYTIVDKPRVKVSLSYDNSAVSVATCQHLHSSNIYLLINKAVWLLVTIVVTCILFSVAPTTPPTTISLLASSFFGLLCGVGFMVAIARTQSPNILLLLNVLAILLPITVYLVASCFGKFQKSTSAKQTAVETTEFGLQTIVPQKISSRQKSSTPMSDAASAVPSNHSVDKSITALMDTVQNKEREIAVLKRKLLKRHYRIRELQQKLSETAESSMQMYS